MEEITIPQLVDFLGRPLVQESMAGSPIYLLRANFSGWNLGRGVSGKKVDEENRQLDQYGLPGGELILPVQYTNGIYWDDSKDKEFISQGLATVFHPAFFNGDFIKKVDDSPYRPLVDGYLDFRDDRVLDDYVSEFLDDAGKANSEFDRAVEFRHGLWIGGLAENNARGLVTEHIKQFARLYKIREFLREPEKSLVSRAFSSR